MLYNKDIVFLDYLCYILYLLKSNVSLKPHIRMKDPCRFSTLTYMYLKSKNISIRLGFQRVQCLVKNKMSRISVWPLNMFLWHLVNHTFVIKEMRSTCVLLRDLTGVIWPPCFAVSWAVSQYGVCVCECMRVWGESEYGRGRNRLLLSLISAVPFNHVAQRTTFTGPIKSNHGKFRTCLHQSGKTWLRTGYPVSAEVSWSWFLFVSWKT